MVFKLMDGSWYHDGLITQWKVFHAETAEECFLEHQRLFQQASTKGEKMEIAGYWVEEQREVDNDHSFIMVQEPYPHPNRIDPPPWLIRELYHGPVG